jgi:hypothetical protein
MTFVTLIAKARDAGTWSVRATREENSLRSCELRAARHPVCSKLAARSSQLTKRGASKLFCGVEFGLESFQIADGQAASIYFQHPFRLEVGKITGNEFAYGANL